MIQHHKSKSTRQSFNAILKRTNDKNEMIFDDIISPDYIDHGQSVYIGSPGRGVAGAKNDLKNSLDKLDDFKYVVEALIASPWYPDLSRRILERFIDTKIYF